MSNIPGSFLWILLTILAAVVALPLGRIGPAAVPQPAPPPPLETQLETSISTVGQDSHHRRLPFTVYVLANDLSWELESTGALEGGQTIKSPELIAAITQASDVFCVGTASLEGDVQAEEARAAQRAFKLSQWVRAAMPDASHARLFTLNAGQYRGPKELQSSYQRRAIILAAGPHDDAVDLGQGLRSGLEQRQETSPFVFSLLHEYSRSREWLTISNRDALNDLSGRTGRTISALPLASRR